MREALLQQFFLGEVSASDLAEDLEGAVVQDSSSRYFHIDEMDTEFIVETIHLGRVCDAALAGELPIDSLESVGFCVVASESFGWDPESKDGDLVSEVLLPSRSATAAAATSRSSPNEMDPSHFSSGFKRATMGMG